MDDDRTAVIRMAERIVIMIVVFCDMMSILTKMRIRGAAEQV